MDIRICPHCKTRVLPSPEGECPQCKGNVEGPPPVSKPQRDGTISKDCPACGCAKYREIRPPTIVVRFAKDRICADCGCRYRPPTPIWAALTLVVIGFLLAAFMGYSATLRLQEANSFLPAVVIELLLALLGLAAIIAGLRAISGSRRSTPGLNERKAPE